MEKNLWVLFIVCLLTGCVTASVTKLDNSKSYPKVNPDHVKVYLSEEDVDCGYEKVALIETKSGYGLKDEKSINKGRKEGGKLGANGLILEGFEDPSTGAKVANAFLGTGASKKGEMLAIREDTTNCAKVTD